LTTQTQILFETEGRDCGKVEQIVKKSLNFENQCTKKLITKITQL
jgi:hypothetical protein